MELFQLIAVINIAGVVFLILVNVIRFLYFLMDISIEHDKQEADSVLQFYAFCKYYNRVYFMVFVISVFIIAIAWANKTPF